MSSAQKIQIDSSNPIPTTYQPLNEYQASQVILNSNKIVINAKDDAVVISGAKGVSISTPEWKADVTEVLNILKDLIAEMKAQADGSSPFVTGVGPTGPNASSLAKLNILEQKLGLLEQ